MAAIIGVFGGVVSFCFGAILLAMAFYFYSEAHRANQGQTLIQAEGEDFLKSSRAFMVIAGLLLFLGLVALSTGLVIGLIAFKAFAR